MTIDVTVRHDHVSDTTQAYAEQKAQELVDSFPRIESVHVVIDRENRDRVVEIAIQARRHVHIEAKGSAEGNLRAAIDMAVDRAERQLRKLQDKVQDHRPKVAKGDAQKADEGEEIEEGVL